MTLKPYLIDDLNKLKSLLSTLDDSQFTQSLKVLSGSTIGQHVRHILEFYLTLVKAKSGVLSYDNRRRDKEMETNQHRCIEIIQDIIETIKTLDETKQVAVLANYSANRNEIHDIKSTLGRESAYVLEHSIHHQAMIKIGLMQLGVDTIADIGVAPATVRARTNAA